MAKELILVVVEGGRVREVTSTLNQEWTVFDWDDFQCSPDGHWEERCAAETREHIRREWPALHDRILETLRNAAVGREAERRKDSFCDVPAV